MLLSSKNDESDGIKTFEVYSSYITLASNIFKQTKTLICVMVYIVEKMWLFEITSSVQEVHVIFKWNNLQSLGKVLLHFKKKHEFCIPYVSLSELA